MFSPTHCKYFVTFIHNFSRFTWIYFLCSKSKVFDAFQKLFAWIENQFSKHVTILCSDSSGEYMSNEFQTFFQIYGITSQRSCPYIPQQNGVAERKNHHLFDVTRTLLESSLPSTFWVEGISAAVHIINRLPSVKLQNQSSYVWLHGQAPTYTNLHTFGRVYYVHLLPHFGLKIFLQQYLSLINFHRLNYRISHLIFDCMDKLLLMQIFMHLDCVHLPPPERNKLVLNLLNESFWVKHQIKRALFVMIHLLVLLILPEMFQLYPTKLPEHPSLVLYNFDNPVEITLKLGWVICKGVIGILQKTALTSHSLKHLIPSHLLHHSKGPLEPLNLLTIMDFLMFLSLTPCPLSPSTTLILRL